jgi:hypothetical protein
MIKYKFSMWTAKRKISLLDVLESIDGESLDWRIEEFYGVASPPKSFSGSSITDFEDFVIKENLGYQTNWSDLMDFARGIDDLIDIRIVGSRTTVKKRSVLIIIEGIDSTEWEINSYRQITGSLFANQAIDLQEE